ncbi:MAG: hypothetical protein Q9M26_07435 [Mariprofundales bacterium]|nr:hypothetical protein [Mariprofundales bacterium]
MAKMLDSIAKSSSVDFLLDGKQKGGVYYCQCVFFNAVVGEIRGELNSYLSCGGGTWWRDRVPELSG